MDVMARLLESLVAAGPLALLLGVACWKLWQANQAERLSHEVEQKAERDRHATEEKELRDKYIALVEKLTTVIRGDDPHV